MHAACHASARVTTGALWRCLRRDDRVRQPTAAVAAALDQRHVDAHRRHEGLQVRVRLVAARLAPDRQRDIAIACVLGVGRSSGRSTWLVRPENQERLDRALAALTATSGWRETFC